MARKKSSPRAAQKSPKYGENGPSDPAWTHLWEQYPEHPALAEEAIYSLPFQLVVALDKEIPKLFTDEDKQFEFDLMDAAPCGFFRQVPIYYPPLLPTFTKGSSEDESEQKMRDSVERIKEMMVDDMQNRGVSKPLIEDFFESPEKQNELLEERRWSYAGWLATSDEFLGQRDQIRLVVQDAQAGVPKLPISPMGISNPAPEGDLEELSQLFLRRWGLEEMATWDLPVPMCPGFTETDRYLLENASEAGLKIFIPWYLLRDRDLKLYDLADRERLLHLPQPLEGWLDPKPKNWGHKRYQIMLRIYVYLELCLKRRYADRIKNNLARVDLALSDFFLGEGLYQGEGLKDESIRKIRLETGKRLRRQS